MMTGVAETVNYQIIQIFDAIERPNQYLRINPDLSREQPLPIDDASEEKISELVRIGKEQAEKYNEELISLSTCCCPVVSHIVGWVGRGD